MNTISYKPLTTLVEKQLKIWTNRSTYVNEQTSIYFDGLNNAIPVCWFGNLDSTKTKVLTFGQNPSFHEFPGFRSKPRFNASIYSSTVDIIKSYNNYFQVNPYKSWFNQIEHLLNLFNASYYDTMQFQYTAIHFDAYSFATKKSQFIKLLKQLNKILIKLSINFLDIIIKHNEINRILIIGRSNYNTFKSNYGISNEKCIITHVGFSNNQYLFAKGDYKGIPVYATSIYLPNHFGKIDYTEIYNILINL